MNARLVGELSRLALADQDGVVAVLRVYLDESGTHEESPAVAVAAYLGRPREWQNWTKKWNAAKGGRIRVFHAVDAQNLRGEFKNWSHDQVAELVKKLLPITAESEIASVFTGIHMGEFNAAMASHPDLLELFGSPYVACLHWTIQIIMNLVFQANNREQIAFIHEVNDYYKEACETFDWIRRFGNHGDNLISITFGSKEKYPPLQAADILAYEGNKRIREPNRPARRPWIALGAHKHIATRYGRANMAELIAQLQRIHGRRFDELNLGSGWRQASWPRGRE